MRKEESLNKIENEKVNMNKRGQFSRNIADLDFVSLLLIIIGGYFLYNNNLVGWFFIGLGILKYLTENR